MMSSISWVKSANNTETDFPLSNLACGVFSQLSDAAGAARCGIAIGDMVFDVQAVDAAGFLAGTGAEGSFNRADWNEFMARGSDVWRVFRARVTNLLVKGAKHQDQTEKMLVPMSDAQLHMPIKVAEFTDFYASKYHASNVGTLFRGPENALPPNWLHMPIGYNGRASSVAVSGTDFHRPWGQLQGEGGPYLAPSKKMDFEVEMGAIIGQRIDGAVNADQAKESIFGFVLLNDWSARDIQAWEYQPLGPFQAKAFATTISPWIVMRDALRGARVPAPSRDIPLLPYLNETVDETYDIDLTVSLIATDGARAIVSHTNAKHLYYSSAQQLAHHSLSGCGMNPGDLLGTGTISGPENGSEGCLLEATANGVRPLIVGDIKRTFLEDGDAICISGHARIDGQRIGFGICTARMLPALKSGRKLGTQPSLAKGEG